MAMTYDTENIFAKILRGQIPAKKIYEDDHVLAFHDINPQAPIHALIIPKGAYVSIDDFGAKASPEEIAGFFRAVPVIAQMLGVVEDGYRTLANSGLNAGQEVPHFHLHLFGGRPLGPMLTRSMVP